eukprot:802753-Rhodomonas_salina.5
MLCRGRTLSLPVSPCVHTVSPCVHTVSPCILETKTPGSYRAAKEKVGFFTRFHKAHVRNRQGTCATVSVGPLTSARTQAEAAGGSAFGRVAMTLGTLRGAGGRVLTLGRVRLTFGGRRWHDVDEVLPFVLGSPPPLSLVLLHPEIIAVQLCCRRGSCGVRGRLWGVVVEKEAVVGAGSAVDHVGLRDTAA